MIAWDAFRFLVPLTLMLLPAIVLGFVQRWARSANRIDPETRWQWFDFARNNVTGAIFLLWWLGLGVTIAHRPVWHLDPVAGQAGRNLAMVVLFLLPPMLLDGFLAGWAAGVRRAVRGHTITAGPLIRNTLYGYWLVLLLVAGIGGVHGLWSDGYRMIAGVIGVAIAFYALVGFNNWRIGRGLPHNPLPDGPLKDFITGLSKKFSLTTVSASYAGPSAEPLTVIQGNQFWFRPDLLRQLDAEEVNALTLREVIRLKRGPMSGWLGALLMFGLIVIGQVVLSVVLAVAMIFGQQAGLRLEAYWPVLVVGLGALAGVMTQLYHLWRERRADAETAETLDDAAVLMTALPKYAALCGWPLPAEPWQDHYDTKPPTLARIEALARLAMLSPEQTAELLADPGTVEHYTAPEEPTGETPRFSVEFRQQVLNRATLTLIAGVLIVATAAALSSAYYPPYGWLAWFVTIPSVGLVLWLGRLWQMPLYRQLRGQLAEKLSRQGYDPIGAHFMGLSPAPGCPVYSYFLEWDNGFVCVAGDDLVYVGEQAQFRLSRDQVTRLRVSSATLQKPGRVHLTWNAPGGEQTFSLLIRHSLDPRSGRSIQQWHQAGADGELAGAWRQVPLRGPEVAPDDGTGRPQWRAVISLALIVGSITWLLATALGLPMFEVEAGSALAAGIGTAVLLFGLVAWESLTRDRGQVTSS